MISYNNRPAMSHPIPPTADHVPTTSPKSSPNPNMAALSTKQKAAEHHHIWLITGPAGCGKSTVAQYLANAMNLPYIEGDEFHPAANVEKMRNNIPLTDADRWDWLTALREESLSRLSQGSKGVVLTCSALKRKYRDVIRVAPYYDHDVRVHFVYLHASEETLMARVTKRSEQTNHYMPASMVHSQFSILQPPTADETDVISVDVSGPIEGVEAEALSKIKEAIHQELENES